MWVRGQNTCRNGQRGGDTKEFWVSLSTTVTACIKQIPALSSRKYFSVALVRFIYICVCLQLVLVEFVLCYRCYLWVLYSKLL